MPPKPKDGGAADAAFTILLRYAEASGHKLSAKHAATSSGIAMSTAFAKISAAKKKGIEKLSSAQLTNALPVLIKYAEASGHKLVAAHVATAAGIAPSTAFARIAQAKSDAKLSAPETNIEATETAPKVSESAKKSPSRPAPKTKKDSKAQAENDESSIETKPNRGRKRTIGVANDQKIEEESEMLHVPNEMKNEIAIKHNNKAQSKDNDDVEKNAKSAVEVGESANNKRGRTAKKPEVTEDLTACVTSGPNGAETEEPPKKKRGRPPKNANDETTPSQPETSSGGGTAALRNSSPVSQDGSRAINAEHAEFIDEERSITLDGAADVKMPQGQLAGDGSKVEGGEEMEGVQDTTDSLVDQYIDFGKGETAAAEAQREAEEDDAWPFA